MAKEWAKKFYASKAWKLCRAAYIASLHDGLCERCKAKGLHTLGYIVHHKITLTPENISDPNIALNHELLEYVCKDCHDEIDEHYKAMHGKKKTKAIREGLYFDDDGQLQSIPP